MRTLFSLIAGLLLIQNASAENYSFILKTQINDEFYINKDKLKQHESGYLVEVLNSYGHPDPFNGAWSSTQIIYFDCNQSLQLMSDKFHSKKMGKGAIVQSSEVPMPKMDIPKGSAFEVIQDVVCKSDISNKRKSPDVDGDFAELTLMLEKNAVAISEGLQYANSNELMSATDAFTLMQKLSSDEVSYESVNFLGAVCQTTPIDMCATILVEAANWDGGIDEFVLVLSELIQAE